MSSTPEPALVILAMIIIVLAIIFGPIISMICIEVLFPVVIPLTIKTWAAAAWLGGCVSAVIGGCVKACNR